MSIHLERQFRNGTYSLTIEDAVLREPGDIVNIWHVGYCQWYKFDDHKRMAHRFG